MEEIKMVDLYAQYQDSKDQIDKAIHSVVRTSAFINGSDVKAFQDELADYLNVRHVITCGNGTDALMLALMVADLKPGDEVITSVFSFIATAEVIALLGLKPVFADIYSDSFNIDVEKLEGLITRKTRAIIPVHLFGQSADMESIMNIAKRHDLLVIEDAAQSVATDYHFSDGIKAKTGTIGNIGCTSFFPSKNLGTWGDGGALYTNVDEYAERARILANHGTKRKYHHALIGVNSRLDTLQAAILRVKLKKLDEYTQRRQEAADYYDHHLKNIETIALPRRMSYSSHGFHQYTVKLNKPENRDDLITYLKGKGIPVMVYYPVPFHLQEAFAYLSYKKGDFPVAEKMAETVLSLPMHPHLTKEQLAYITEHIKAFFYDG